MGDIPLKVLLAASALTEAGQEQVNAVLPLRQQMAANLSRNGDALLLPDAEHITIVTDQQHAREVTAAVLAAADEASEILAVGGGT